LTPSQKGFAYSETLGSGRDDIDPIFPSALYKMDVKDGEDVAQR
jgi:hypothetical protein